MNWQFLHTTGPHTKYLDHKLTPEVSAMFAAMASRAPLGGIEARYTEVVEAIAKNQSFKDNASELFAWAEDQLTQYPLHSKIQEFFDQFVGKYGHSSILELTGQPAVYVEGISWFTAYTAFDSPLCTGQEASTRAIRHKNWPMCMEAKGLKDLKELHLRWLDIFDKEVNHWKKEFSKQSVRDSFGLKDKEPFRPALDRARWALPGTISTGFCQTGHLRERSRVIAIGKLLQNGTTGIWDEIADAYTIALPGLSGLGLKEAVYGGKTQLPGHLDFSEAIEDGPDVSVYPVICRDNKERLTRKPYSRQSERSYLDPYMNHYTRVNFEIQCSTAVLRDWHRHRTFYPLQLRWVFDKDGAFVLDHHYHPRAAKASEVKDLLTKSGKVFRKYVKQGRLDLAALAIPFGARCSISGQAGLRDFMYAFELRANAHGANFEYEEQARKALQQLAKYKQLGIE